MSTPSKTSKIQPTPGSPAAHQIEMDRLTLKNERLEAKLKVATDSLAFATKHLKRIENDYKARVMNTLKLDIQDVLRCTDQELAQLTHGKTVEELEATLSNILLVEINKPGKPGTHKSIRAGAAIPKYGQADDMTVPDIFGKTAAQVREMVAGEK